MPAALVVDQLRILLVSRILVGTRGMLQLGNRFGLPHVLLATHPICVLAAGVQRVCQHRIHFAESAVMFRYRLTGNLGDADTFNVARRAGEVLLDESGIQTHCLEDLCTTIRLVGGDAHFRHHLVQPLADSLDVVFDCLSRFQIDARRDVLQRIHCQPGMNRFRSVSCQQRKVMNFARRPGTDDQAGAGTQALSDQVMMYPGRRQ